MIQGLQTIQTWITRNSFIQARKEKKWSITYRVTTRRSMNVLMNVLRFWRVKNKRSPFLNPKEVEEEVTSKFFYIINPSSNDDSDKMKSALEQAIVTSNPNVSWDDISGLEGAKKAL